MKSFLLMILLLVALFGCSRKEEATTAPPSRAGAPLLPQPDLPREELVKKVIKRYNFLLAEGYRNLNMNPLQEVATVEQAEKAYTHMAAIGEGKARMVSQMRRIDYLQLLFPSEEKAAVRTREIWDFAYTDIKTGRKSEEVKEFPYDVTYTLEKRAGRWLITDVVAGSERDAGENPPKEPRAGAGGHP
jgi:hypothetical protein